LYVTVAVTVGERRGDSMRKYTIKVFFTDSSQLSIDCDDFIIVDSSHYYALRDDMLIMTFPLINVKYTVTVIN